MSLMTFLTFLNLLILVMADLDIASMLQSTAGRRLQEEPSCLSFIHILRTGGGAIALGRLLSAGADLVGHNDSCWYDRKCSTMVADTRRKAGSLVEGNPLPAYGKKYGRMWGPCDDQLPCSYGEDVGEGQDRHRMCYVPKQWCVRAMTFLMARVASGMCRQV